MHFCIFNPLPPRGFVGLVCALGAQPGALGAKPGVLGAKPGFSRGFQPTFELSRVTHFEPPKSAF